MPLNGNPCQTHASHSMMELEQRVSALEAASPTGSVSGSVSWADVTGKPLTFPPDAHNHDAAYEAKNANIQAHVSSAHAPSDAQKNSDITKAEIEAKLTGEISTHTHAGGSDPFIFKGATAADITTGANITPVNVTGLVFNFIANSKYAIEIFGAIKAAAATTGAGLQFDTSVAVTRIRGTFFHQLANTGTLSGGSTIADDASAGVSSGIPGTNTDTPFYWAGSLITGANAGTAQLRLRSETTAAVTLSADTLMRVQKLV